MSEKEMANAHIKARDTITMVYAQLPVGVSTSDLDDALNYYSHHSFWDAECDNQRNRERFSPRSPW